MSVDSLARVLWQHTITEVFGGTATGSTWRCRCGASGRTMGTRDTAGLFGRQHTAEEILAHLNTT